MVTYRMLRLNNVSWALSCKNPFWASQPDRLERRLKPKRIPFSLSCRSRDQPSVAMRAGLIYTNQGALEAFSLVVPLVGSRPTISPCHRTDQNWRR